MAPSASACAKPKRHSFALLAIWLCIRLVALRGLSFRGAAAAMRELSALHGLKAPSHVTIQNWVLKCGVARLDRRPGRRNDWIYILDNTVEYGTQKCLLVLGLPLETFRRNQCRVNHADVSVLGLVVVDKMNAKCVERTLAEVAATVGAPVQIVTDHGPDVKKGVEAFVAASATGPVYTYDITHKAGTILKRVLKDDADWPRFVRGCADAKRLVVGTEMAHLAPPKLSDKARWLNLDAYVDWAARVAVLLAEASADPARRPEADRLGKFFGWLHDFEPQLARWSAAVGALQAARDEVKTNGLHKGSAERLAARLAEMPGGSAKVPTVEEELLRFLREETAALRGEGPWLGTSDIIESVFGKYKSVSHRASIKGVGKAVLAIPVFTGCLPMEEVRRALETVRCADAQAWVRGNLGPSLLAKRRKALGGVRKSKNRVNLSQQESTKTSDS